MSLYVKYIDVPVGAQEDMDVQTPASQPFSTGNLAEGLTDEPWATLEPNGWLLDGTRKILPDDASGIGWWSAERSGEDGKFTENPVFVLRFWDNTYSTSGITISFWESLGHWCNEIKVRWYFVERIGTDFSSYERTLLGDEIVAYPDRPSWTLDHSVSGFNEIEIEIVSTNNPGQFAKIHHIQIGQVIIFAKDELVRVSLLTEVDPSSLELSADSSTVEIMDQNGRNLKPQKNQKMQLFRNGELIASHYISEVTREKKNSYKFQCYSMIGRLEEAYLGGLYEETSAELVLSEVLGDIPYVLDIQDATITGYLPVCTKREALQQIAFAIGAVVTTQTNGTIHLSPLNDDISSEFSEDKIFTGAKLQAETQIAKIKVSDHIYGVSYAEEVTVLDSVLVQGKDVLVLFNAPYYVEETALSDLLIADYEIGVNYVRITTKMVEGTYRPTTLTIKGYKVVSAATENIWENPNVLPGQGRELVVDNATLVNPQNVDAIIERLKKYGDLRSVLTQEVVVDMQKAGDKVISPTPLESTIEGYITSMESEFTQNGHTASITIRGKEE